MLEKKRHVWDDFLNSQKHQVYVLSATIPMFVMLMVWFFMGVFPFGSKSLMAVDFGQQYIGLYAFLKETIITGDWSGLFYSFSKSIGGAMIGIWGFNLISPFNLLYVLLPLSEFKWAIFLTIWFRYGVTGLAMAHLLIKRYKGMSYNPWLVPLMATSYALSGMIVSYQMNPIFYDAMIMLPLIIISLEEVLDGAKPFKYMLLLAATMLLHFYMGYMICLFIALYTFYYLSPKLEGDVPWSEKIVAFFKPIGKVIGSSIVGILLVMVLLLPIFLNLLRSKGAYESSMTFQWALQINPLDILSKLMIGAFDNDSWPAGPNLPNIFIGGIGLLGYFAYFRTATVAKSRKIVAVIMSLIFLVSFSHEFTNKIWHMGQTPAGFFYRFSWIVSFFMVLLAYQAVRENTQATLKEKFILLSGLIVTIGYVVFNIEDYSYLSFNQPQQVTDSIVMNSEVVFVLLMLLSSAIIYWIWKQWQVEKSSKIVATGIVIAGFYPVVYALHQGWALMQIPLTVLSWVGAYLFIYVKPKKMSMLLVTLITAFELGYNAYLSQVRIGYDDAFKFTDATISMQEVVDEIKKMEANNTTDANKFYRVASSFYYAKNDPFLLDYNGLSNFSSNMEKSTIDLFGWMGDVGGNAATFYANGTGLTDTLYGVRYYIDTKPYTNDDVTNNPKKRYFSPISTRKELQRYFTQVYENDRYILYRRNVETSIAYATNQTTTNIKFGENNPTANQNIILNSMSGQDVEFFQQYAFQEIVLSNMEQVNNGSDNQIFRRIDKNLPGQVTFKTTPQSDQTYYITAPYNLRKSKGSIDILLNNSWYAYTQSYDRRQLWNIAYQSAGQPIEMVFRTSTEDQIDLTGMILVRSDNDAMDAVISARLPQKLNVTEWGNNFLNGQLTVSDTSDMMLTTIPYNPGWKVKVDGKTIQTQEVWGSLLAFPITAGEHQIEMVFIPDGFVIGAMISLVTMILVAFLWYREKMAQKS